MLCVSDKASPPPRPPPLNGRPGRAGHNHGLLHTHRVTQQYLQYAYTGIYSWVLLEQFNELLKDLIRAEMVGGNIPPTIPWGNLGSVVDGGQLLSSSLVSVQSSGDSSKAVWCNKINGRS